MKLTFILIVIGLTALSQALDTKTTHTSFGKLPLSNELSQPAYQVPKAKKEDASKLFLGELTKTDNAGKNSPGPVYKYQDQIKYDHVSYTIVLSLSKYLFVEYRCQDGQWEQK